MALNLMRWFQPGAVTKAETPEKEEPKQTPKTSSNRGFFVIGDRPQISNPFKNVSVAPSAQYNDRLLQSAAAYNSQQQAGSSPRDASLQRYRDSQQQARSTRASQQQQRPWVLDLGSYDRNKQAETSGEGKSFMQLAFGDLVPSVKPANQRMLRRATDEDMVEVRRTQNNPSANTPTARDLFKPGAIKKQGINEFAELDDAGYAALSAEKRAIVDFNTQLQAALDKDAALKGQKADDDYIQRANKLFASDDASRSYNPNTLSLLETLGADLKNTKMDDYTSGRMNLSFEDLTSTAKTKGVSKEFYDGLQESIQRPTAQRAFGRADFANLVSESTAKRMTDVIMRGQSFLGGEADTSLSLDSETEGKFDYLYNIMTGFSADETGAPVLDANGSPSRVDGATYENMVESINAEGLDLATFQTYADRRLRSELYDLNGDDDYLKLRSAYLPEIERALFGGG